MTESRTETPFDKGARILNAVIAEVDLSADLKGNAQSVIRMLAELLPQLLAPPAAAPASSKPAPASTTPSDDSMNMALLGAVLDKAIDECTKKTRAERPKTTTAPKPKARPRTPVASAANQQPAAAPAGVPEADVQLIWDTYAMVMELQRNHAEHLSEALIVTSGERFDPARVVQIMTSASLGAARLWRAALVDLTQA